MTTKHTGGHAFPTQSWDYDGGGQVLTYQEPGMSLRDWFAGLALQGLLANSGGPVQRHNERGWDFVNCELKEVAYTAYAVADAMLKAREET